MNLPKALAPITVAKTNKQRAEQLAGLLDNIEFHTRDFNVGSPVSQDIVRNSLADAYVLLRTIEN